MGKRRSKSKVERRSRGAVFRCSDEERRSLRNRLARLAGQITAIQRMIETDEACELIVQQMAAARAAMNRAFAYVLARMVLHCQRAEVSEGQRRRMVQVTASLIERYS